MNKAHAIDLAKSGHLLVCEHSEEGQPRWAIRGYTVHPNTAQAVIKELGLQPNNDCLFPEAESQTYGLPKQ